MPPNDAPPETLNAFERPPWNRPWLWYLLAAAVLAADFFTSAYLLFPIFFIIPVLLVSWHGKLSHALALVVVLCAARLSFHFHWGLPWGMGAAIFNTVIRLIVLGLVAVLTSRVASQTREMRRRVRLLEGMLPICGFCKDIRDDAGQWVQLESYITRHSEAQFSTGVCDECGRKHLGPVYQKSRVTVRV